MELWDHQKQTVDFCHDTPRVYDLSSPGTGKTISHLQYVKEAGLRTLVVCPKTLMFSAWGNDIEQHDMGMEYAIARAVKREETFTKAAASDKQIVITNNDAVKWLDKHPKIVDQFDAIVCDESTYFKNQASARSKAARRVFKRFDIRHNLTGTPNPKGVQDVWHQVRLLDEGERLFPTLSKFRFRYCRPVPIPGQTRAVKWVDKPGAMEEIVEMIADITVRHDRAECMDIPPNRVIWRPYELNPATRKILSELQKESFSLLNSGEPLTAVNAGVLQTKMLQVASGAVYTSEGEYTVIDTGRYELVAEMVEEYEHSIVFFLWSHQKEQLAKEFDRRGISFRIIDGKATDNARQAAVQDFQAGRLDVLLLHPETAAHGLTLTRGRAVIWASPPLCRGDWLEQGIARIVRGGQTQETDTIFVHAPNTPDRRNYNVAKTRATSMDLFTSYAKELTQ